jgi:hypothetical protein
MRTVFLMVVILFPAISVFSQVVIEESDLMQPGDTFLIHVDLNPSVTVDLAPGSNLSWNFTGLQNDQSNFASYAPADTLDFINEFPMSEFYTYGPGFLYAGPGGIAPLDNWGYMMFFTNADGLFTEGFYSDYGMGYRSTLYNNPEMLMFTDAHYLDEHSTDSYWEVNINVSDEIPVDLDTLYHRNVSKVLNADSWGSLITDYGTYDVLRIHETGISIDSAFVTYNSAVVFSMEMERDTINNYYFWAKALRNPVLTLHCDYDNNIERIDYLMGAIYASKSDLQTGDQFVYPNPASDNLQLSGFTGITDICDISGKVVLSFTVNGDVSDIDISGLKQGFYLITDNKGKTTKFVKE